MNKGNMYCIIPTLKLIMTIWMIMLQEILKILFFDSQVYSISP